MTLGQIGYEAYAKSTGGKTFDGRDMPTWETLPERIQRAWNAAAHAIVSTYRDYCNYCNGPETERVT